MILFDIETDGLLEDVTRIHCLSYTRDGSEVRTTDDYDYMRRILRREDGLIGHNIIRYDIPVLEKILGIKIKAQLFDTLPMSWVINFDRSRHGLEYFGDDYGIPKPEINDWRNLTLEEYTHRCEQDVKINWILWQDLLKKFMFLYKNNKAELNRFFRYLSFKMDCARAAEMQGWRLDVSKAKSCISQLKVLQEQKVAELTEVMPMRKVMTEK